MQSIVGTWRLVKAESHDPNGKPLPTPYGGKGMGRVTFNAEGRMAAVVVDGRRATHARQSHRGDFSEPFSEGELRAKFRELAGTVLTPEGAAQVEAAIERSEDWPSLAALTYLCRRYLRSDTVREI